MVLSVELQVNVTRATQPRVRCSQEGQSRVDWRMAGNVVTPKALVILYFGR